MSEYYTTNKTSVCQTYCMSKKGGGQRKKKSMSESIYYLSSI